ncbi:hypothetical protein M3649_13445 [Ureibacillus chungkukjangi]|uniref:hypothetical protein n=1 Tax=Ureibacillus chungkukjangi TaxID=1202712 RepID=UPI00203D5592|nr:hypothetical protein [Ureibacillus chungkukjangi]MCM3389141.1 hypothetical protein [Ureibacillus chungkukjangi]
MTNLTDANDISLARVADAAGNYTSDLSGSINVVAPATIDFEVEATGTKTIVVTFDGVLSSFVGTDLVLKKDTTTITPAKVKSGVDADGNTTVTYTLNDADEMTYDALTAGGENKTIL